jgi:CheY-like chemotaxis protein
MSRQNDYGDGDFDAQKSRFQRLQESCSGDFSEVWPISRRYGRWRGYGIVARRCCLGERGRSWRRSSEMKQLRVLVVEQDAIIGALLSEMLEDLGHVICAVEGDSGNAAATAERCRPDLMIIDIGLGDDIGVAAVQAILRKEIVPHVFVTGDVLRNLSLGANVVLLQKPVRGQDITRAIRNANSASALRKVAARG